MHRRIPAYSLCAALALATVAGCGEGGDADRPNISPTISPTRTLPEPTRTAESPEPEPTETQPEPEPEPTETQPEPEPTEAESEPEPTEAESEPEPEPEPTETQPEPEPEPSETAADEQSGDEAAEETEEDDTPPWVWLLAAVLVLLAVLMIALIVRSRRRRGSWHEQYDAAIAEVAWFARELLPQLRRAPSVERLAGGWQVGSGRVAAVEDQLTALEATAGTEDDRERARNLRDTVRLARGRIEALTGPGPHPEWALDVDDVIAALEAAIAPPPPAR